MTIKDLHDDLDLLFEAGHLYSLTDPESLNEINAEILADAAIRFENIFGHMPKGRRMQLVLLIMARYAEWIRANDKEEEVHKLSSSIEVGRA